MLTEYLADYLNSKNIKFNIEDYDFLKNSNIILLGFGGSYAYGTNIETSDIDIRGIAMNSAREVLLGQDFEQIVDEKTDTTIYSLKKMCNLLMNCNPNCIEILGLKDYIYLSPIGERLLKNKDMFLSKKCINSFMGYANQQMYRLQQKSLVAMSEKEFNEHILKTIKFMQDDLRKNYNMDGIEFHLVNNKIVMDANLKDYPMDDFSDVLGILNKTIRDYNKNSKRNEKALAHNKINKHAMHLLRLYMMCEDILLYGEINTYREKEHDLLMAIRNGEYMNDDGKPKAEFYDLVHDYENRIEIAKQKSVIPDQPDIKRIEEFLMDSNLEII